MGGEEYALPADRPDREADPVPDLEPDGEAGPEPDLEPAFEPGPGSRRRGRARRRGWGGESTPDREDAPPGEPADPAAQARALCLRLLTGSPRTRRQLADAMRKRGLPEEVAEEVLSRFEEVGLIDDAAFAGAWVESRHRGRGLARRALAMELRSRGVDNTVVAEAVSQLDPEQEADTARELVERKLRSTSGLDRQVRIRRLAGMLARRGYSEGLALRVVRAALDAEQVMEPEEDE
ncbi:recombination regulator RecX [Streptacidiphilus sp. MAP12-16]|uniref:recombination regulator RecX n=1 Tax=Streptacidiphilus sp. MAP12-16 TaxID=3156300 RepID=UPI003514CA3C